MKFLCDNCKAKYQIADEKVAGKTVRMKCRKCGHQIEVRAAITETSVAGPPPHGSIAPRPPPKPPGAGLATSLSQAKPRSTHPSIPGVGSGALAGAFARTVQEGSGPGSSDIELSVTDEWYVAINGVPVGPVRISELRRKAGAGAVTEDSLCWQEGLEEWRPIRSVPELAAIVREAAQGNRVSLVTPPPAESRPSIAPRPPQRPPPPRASEVPQRPSALPRNNVVPLHARGPDKSDDAPITSPLFGGGALATASAPGIAPRPQSVVPPAPVPPPPAPVAPPPPPAAASAPFAFTDPFAPVAPAPVPSAPATMQSSPAIPTRASLFPPAAASFAPPTNTKRGPPLWFWPILLFTLGFGGVAAVFLFRAPPAAPPPVVIQMPPTATPSAATTSTPSAAASADVVPSATTTATGKVATGGGGQKTSSGGTAATATTGKAADLSGLGLVPGGGGPNVGPGGGSGPSSGGGLDQAGVERVVSGHRNGVKRQCWDRADQKSSVNVTVSATVGAGGDVVSTSSSGDDPVVAKCIENQVRTWKFPAPGQSTQIAIPFKFVRQ